MGSNESTSTSPIPNNYLVPVYENLSANRYGEVSLHRESASGRLVLIREFLFENISDYKEELSLITKQLSESHPHLLKIFSYHTHKEDYLCSSVHKIQLVLEYQRYDLLKEVMTRQIQMVYFTEDALLYIMKCTIAGLCALQNRGISHGGIKASVLFYDNTQCVKLADPLLYNTLSDYAHVISKGKTKGIYLSPELMKSLERKELKPIHNKIKSDVFSLGIVFIELALLESCDDVYDYENYTIKYDLVFSKIVRVGKVYSAQISDVLKMMVEIDETVRVHFFSLANILNIETSGKIKKPNSNNFSATPVSQISSSDNEIKGISPKENVFHFSSNLNKKILYRSLLSKKR